MFGTVLVLHCITFEEHAYSIILAHDSHAPM